MKEMKLGAESGEMIQLMHANAYTPGCYIEMCKQLANYNIVLPEQRPLWENQEAGQLKNWTLFADDLIADMDDKSRKNVIGIGHSMGGIASWLAAIKRPDLFKRLILIDPVVLPSKLHNVMSVIPYWLKKKMIPMIEIASRRTHLWKDKDAARDYVLSKKVFQRFDPIVLEDFIKYGLKETDDGVTLAYPRDWESRVYGSSPNMWNKMNTLPCPITILRAEYSDVLTDDRWAKIRNKLKGGEFIQLDEAGHLVPFEKPEICGKLIKEILDNKVSK